MPAFAYSLSDAALPGYSMAREQDPNGVDDQDWSYYYVGIFCDRDMFMRYLGGGVGHRATGVKGSLVAADWDDPGELDGEEDETDEAGEDELDEDAVMSESDAADNQDPGSDDDDEVVVDLEAPGRRKGRARGRGARRSPHHSRTFLPWLALQYTHTLVAQEEMCILQESVRSVKTEFADLDGLSWDTPEAREELAQWHAEQPGLSSRLNPASLRRSGSACVFPPAPLSLSFAHVSASTPDLTPMPSPVDEDDDEHTITRPLSMDSRRSSAATIVPDREDARTPLPALLSSDADADGQENTRPALPKSLSAPHLARPANPLADATNAHIRAPLPPSRIPVRSKSLSAVSSAVHAPTRHASLSARPWGPRTIHLPRLGRPSTSGANTNGRRIRLTGLSASPARLHPAPASSSARPDAHEQPDERLASPSRPHRSKLRIVSAPSPGGRGRGFPDPLVRVRGVGVCRVVASGSATAAGASSTRGRAGSAGEQEGARGAKRGRATPDAVEDRDSVSPSPSPSRLRAASGSSSGASRMRPVPAGGVPMQRT